MPNRQHQRNRALGLIAQCPVDASITDIARQTGLSRSTVRRYLSDPGAVAEARERIARGDGPLPPADVLETEIMRELRQIGTDPSIPAYARTNALGKLAEIIREQRQTLEFEQRLRELEEQAGTV